MLSVNLTGNPNHRTPGQKASTTFVESHTRGNLGRGGSSLLKWLNQVCRYSFKVFI